jgi:hypothetical protein
VFGRAIVQPQCLARVRISDEGDANGGDHPAASVVFIFVALRPACLPSGVALARRRSIFDFHEPRPSRLAGVEFEDPKRRGRVTATVHRILESGGIMSGWTERRQGSFGRIAVK